LWARYDKPCASPPARACQPRLFSPITKSQSQWLVQIQVVSPANRK
jgi:hypothetical protein